jgi:hypothetical protein
MSIARCRCGKTKHFRGHRRHFTCAECLHARQEERRATSVEVRCFACGHTTMVPAKQIRRAGPFDGVMCGHSGCKVEGRQPEFPADKLVGWFFRSGQDLPGGFRTYRFVRATPEDVAAVWRACEIRDAGLRQLRQAGGTPP